MNFIIGADPQDSSVPALFRDTFSDSEGVEEGALIAEFVTRLLESTPPQDLFVVSAVESGGLAGCICFSRLIFDQDNRTVFILSPVAVRTDRQGTGIGQNLIAFGLEHLRLHGVDIALTYGDPNFYAKVGFQHVSAECVPPPLPLSHPEGWLGQSLTDAPLHPLMGASRCVEALNNPDLW
ncbi:N-acetyltransferase [Shimia sp. SDUM112013]|uniref:GNAT family N-acetyltransferase n=1 Tax=Shimia sp. SDUM112013 TaxID=3136160 RepID=UPI0032F088D7